MPEDAAGILIAAAMPSDAGECAAGPLLMLAVLSANLIADGNLDGEAATAEAAAPAMLAERIAGHGSLMDAVRRALAGGGSASEPALQLVSALQSHNMRRRPREAVLALLGNGLSLLLDGGGARLGEPSLGNRLLVLARLLLTCGDEQQVAVAAMVVEHGFIPLLLRALSNHDFNVKSNAMTVLVRVCCCPVGRVAATAHPAALAAFSNVLRDASALAGVAGGTDAHVLPNLAGNALQAIWCLIADSIAAGDAFASMALAPSGSGILEAVALLLAAPEDRHIPSVRAAAASALNAITRVALHDGRLAALQTRRPLVLGAAEALVWVAEDLRWDGRSNDGEPPPDYDKGLALEAAEALLAALDCLTDATADDGGGGAAAALGTLCERGPEALRAFRDAAAYAAGTIVASRPGACKDAQPMEEET
ncbi:hypothetical protein MNEG_5718 [Monoraphidium neglectum]|uniref:Armadillo repeat-containing protein 8 n=1 Tax=Monoraphidium neglectum TaxID=145388 RepID=A0A0D2N983_9CHLO|nr:hypothetical protein MNEG_5718 [Monoraphidium neglectum]KIZ02236.1 hypothetical protein MNEG_5718 [Monoraphidium neglectum]|eukprot:XP_013901255.1 hypothetical protein MNEG_5718 [Monoraphidium neglectum]